MNYTQTDSHCCSVPEECEAHSKYFISFFKLPTNNSTTVGKSLSGTNKSQYFAVYFEGTKPPKHRFIHIFTHQKQSPIQNYPQPSTKGHH